MRKKYKIFFCILKINEERSQFRSWIQIRIRIPDPDPLVRGMVPVPHQNAPDPNTGFKLTMKIYSKIYFYQQIVLQKNILGSAKGGSDWIYRPLCEDLYASWPAQGTVQ
jgi:hypothetical protein